jgi:hypothetical protein
MMTKQTERRTAVLAAASACAGVAVLAVLFFVQVHPSPFWLWLVLVVVFVTLEFWSVEINDRLFISSSIMVMFTGMVVFDRPSAVLAVTLMAAAAVVHPDDLRMRRWRQPVFNFGQLVIASAVGASVLYPFLPSDHLVVGDLPLLVGGAVVAAAAYNWVNFRLVRTYVAVAYPERSRETGSSMVWSHLVHALLGAYGALLGAAYVLVGPEALPLMLLTFLIGHFGFATYSRVRQAHEDTVRGFVKAIEALDPYTRGHTERVTNFCQLVSNQLGLSRRQAEVLRWSAQIHEVGKLAAPPELLSREGELDAAERRRLDRRMAVVENLLEGVEFLAPSVAELHAESTVGRILRVADAFDALTSTRSYRSAVSQSEAFAVLGRDAELYGPDVVEALIVAVSASGVVHGPPDGATSDEVQRLVDDRARRD